MSIKLRAALQADRLQVNTERSFVVRYFDNHQSHYLGPVCTLITYRNFSVVQYTTLFFMHAVDKVLLALGLHGIHLYCESEKQYT